LVLVYEVKDFATPAAMWAYAQHLRMTIPIVLSLLEIASFQATGSTWLVDTVLYRSVLVLAFTSAIAYGAWRRRGATPDRGALIDPAWADLAAGRNLSLEHRADPPGQSAAL
jgi:hypothetical protein